MNLTSFQNATKLVISSKRCLPDKEETILTCMTETVWSPDGKANHFDVTFQFCGISVIYRLRDKPWNCWGDMILKGYLKFYKTTSDPKSQGQCIGTFCLKIGYCGEDGIYCLVSIQHMDSGEFPVLPSSLIKADIFSMWHRLRQVFVVRNVPTVTLLAKFTMQYCSTFASWLLQE